MYFRAGRSAKVPVFVMSHLPSDIPVKTRNLASLIVSAVSPWINRKSWIETAKRSLASLRNQRDWFLLSPNSWAARRSRPRSYNRSPRGSPESPSPPPPPEMSLQVITSRGDWWLWSPTRLPWHQQETNSQVHAICSLADALAPLEALPDVVSVPSAKDLSSLNP